MSVEKKLSAREIVKKVGICDAPEYYSGRRATLSDLDSQRLDRIYVLIGQQHGSAAADNFAQMVANANDLAASNFLTCLFHLEAKGWRYDGSQSDLPGGIAVPKDKEGNYDLLSGMVGLFNALHSPGTDQTEMIRGEFLHKRGILPIEHIRRYSP